jgi:hypothetical protein
MFVVLVRDSVASKGACARAALTWCERFAAAGLVSNSVKSAPATLL